MINLKNVTYQYRKGVPILDNISAELKPGHIYGLLGLNGVGKTTLLKNLGGLLFPKSGSIKIDGFRPGARAVDFLSNIYFVTDHADLPHWRIGQFQEVYGALYPKFDTVYFYSLLESFQIDVKKNIKSLSFGQAKKVNIAFALATNVRLIMMDEPTNGLDIPSKTQFRKMISRYVTDERIVIISTHQIRDIHNLIDHLLVLNNSRLMLDQSISSLQQSFTLSKDPEDAARALYTEQNMHGTLSLIPNMSAEEGAFDIEFFFNALAADPSLIRHLKKPQATL